MPDKTKNHLVAISMIALLLIILLGFLSVIFISILYINIAGGDFSFDAMFSGENIDKALLIFLVSAAVILPVLYFLKMYK